MKLSEQGQEREFPVLEREPAQSRWAAPFLVSLSPRRERASLSQGQASLSREQVSLSQERASLSQEQA